uniref:4HAUS augmin-like complex, subunit 8 n=1 Tax=Mus musculus TaxID=10090 RepID=D6RCV2_MOUSE
MADSSERDAGKSAAAGACAVPKTKGRRVQGRRVVESRYLQYDKKAKKVSGAAKEEKPPEGRKASTVPRSRESQVMGTGNLQSTMLEGHGMNPPDLDLSAIDGSAGDHGHDGVTDTADDPAVCEDGEQPGSAGGEGRERLGSHVP